MDLSLFDAFLAFCLVAGLPLWGMRSWRKLRAGLERGTSSARGDAYRRVLVVEWSLVGFVLAHAFLRSIDLASLGIAVPLDTRFAGAMLVSGALVMFVIGQARAALRDEETQVAAREQIESLRPMLPHTPRENALFRAVAWTAGICEEVLYRGYLPWLFAHFMPVAAAFAMATVAFGLGHVYQGVSGIVKTTVIGAIMAGLTYASGSLLPAIVLHVALDAVNGNLAYRLITTAPAAPDPEDEPDV